MIALKCDACNGQLVADDSGEFFFCEYCGTKYTHNRIQTKLQEITGTVSINNPVEVFAGNAEKERKISVAQNLLDSGVLDEAKRMFHEVTSDFPDDYRGWWGCIQSGDCYDDYYKKAITLAPDEMKNIIIVHQKLKNVSDELSQCQIDLELVNDRIESLENKHKYSVASVFKITTMLMIGLICLLCGPLLSITGVIGIGLIVFAMWLFLYTFQSIDFVGLFDRSEIQKAEEERISLYKKKPDLIAQKNSLIKEQADLLSSEKP